MLKMVLTASAVARAKPDPEVRGNPTFYWDAKLGGFDQGFRRKLHAGGPEIKTICEMLRETAQATVYVSHTSSKKQIHNCRKHGGSDVFVMPWHGAGLDLTQESIANNELVPLMPLGYKRVYFREIIAVIAIANDNELPFSLFNSSAQGAAVPSGDGVHHPSAMKFGNLGGTVSGTVI